MYRRNDPQQSRDDGHWVPPRWLVASLTLLASAVQRIVHRHERRSNHYAATTSEEWKEILGQAGIKDVRLHDARHTAGTLLGELHVDIHVIQRILGHAQVTTTRIYTDPTDLLTREAADRIGGLLWPDEE